MLKYENIQIQMVELPALTHECTKKWLPSLIPSADIIALVIDLSDLSEFEIIKEQMDSFVSKKTLIIANKTDLPEATQNLEQLRREVTDMSIMTVSCEQMEGLEELQTRIYELLDIIRIYTKEPGKDPEMTHPIVLPGGSTVLNAARDIHKDFANNLRYARIWGADKFNGQRAARNQQLTDGDIIEFHI
jgi:ribosome-interacting GTPase 1